MGKQSRRVTQSNLQSNDQEARSNSFYQYLLWALIIFTGLLFVRVANYEFTNWDDPAYVTANPLIQDFSWNGLKAILTTPVIGMYNPIPFLIYMVIYKIWGLSPTPYHLFNLLFHLLGILVLYRFILRMTDKPLVALIVATLFALHPLHAGVVGWVSQSKTSICIIFYFLGLTAYINYIRTNFQTRPYVYSLILFALACLSKPSGVTFAPMLFLIDYYLSRERNRRWLLDKIPFFVVALIFGLLTLFTHGEENDSIFEVGRHYSLINNIFVSNYSIAFYIEKFIYPKNLSTIYGYPSDNQVWLPIQYYLAAPIITLIVLLVYKSGKFRKEMVFGLLFFVIAISVLIRPVASGFFGTANRYTYLSYTGLFFILAQFISYVREDKIHIPGNVRKWVFGLFGIYLVFCVHRTNMRIQVWENSVTLFTDVIAKQPRLAVAYNQRATARSERGDITGAIEDLTKAIEFDPTYAAAYNNRGALQDNLQHYDSALEDLNKALKLNPEYQDAYENRGNTYLHLSKHDLAMENYDSAISLGSQKGTIYYNRALLKITTGDTAGAIRDLIAARDLGIEQSIPYLLNFSTAD